MPYAVTRYANGLTTVLCADGPDELLTIVQKLHSAPAISDVDVAKAWLHELGWPCGWFDSICSIEQYLALRPIDVKELPIGAVTGRSLLELMI